MKYFLFFFVSLMLLLPLSPQEEIFVINPAGERMSSMSSESGEDSLRFLARESGGKYMEGEET